MFLIVESKSVFVGETLVCRRFLELKANELSKPRPLGKASDGCAHNDDGATRRDVPPETLLVGIREGLMLVTKCLDVVLSQQDEKTTASQVFESICTGKNLRLTQRLENPLKLCRITSGSLSAFPSGYDNNA
jgi:hypothetical protein